MTDWSEDTVHLFLEAYQNEKCIWNPKDVHHKNRKKVNDAWTRLSEIMNKSVKELKNKKEVLMATFRRHYNYKKKNRTQFGLARVSLTFAALSGGLLLGGISDTKYYLTHDQVYFFKIFM